MVADDDGDADDDFPAIGAESQLKTLGVTAFHISPKDGCYVFLFDPTVGSSLEA